MNIKRLMPLLAALTLSCFAFGEETPPALPMSKAAKLAEDAIAAASLPANCFVRSISLVQKSDVPYYRVAYKPPAKSITMVGTEPTQVAIDVIHVTMDGKVSFGRFAESSG